MAGKNRVCVMFRQITFNGGMAVQIPLACFRDRSDASKAGEGDLDQLMSLAGPHATRAILQRLGVVGVSHGFVEMDLVEGAGLVLVGADALPPGGARS